MELNTLLLLGLLLAGGVLGGLVARLLRLPALTGYLAAGILFHFGSSRGWVDGHALEKLRMPINDLAMAMALFVLGGQFRFGRRRNATFRRLLRGSMVESAITFLIVAGLSLPVIQSIPGAMILGVLAIAVAPATTLEVLHEYNAKGPTTGMLKQLTAMSNIWAVFLFEVAILVLLLMEGTDVSLWAPLWDIGGALLYGFIAAHALILLQERVGHDNYAVPLLAIIFLTIGICAITKVPHMLAFLATGAVVANRSQLFERITTAMDGYAKPAIMLFFVLSGSHLDFQSLLDNWLAVGLYVLGRTLGKVLGTHISMSGLKNINRLGSYSKVPVGLGLLCQAGAAIALATYVKGYDEELSERLLNIILGAVVIFELLGPLLVKRVVVLAGEVSLANLMSHTADREGRRGWRNVFRRAFSGRDFLQAGESTEMHVERFMRPTTAALPREANMTQILHFANKSPFNHFPVINHEHHLVGVVTLNDLSQVAYDKATAALVTADDVATLSPAEAALPSTATLEEALEFFRKFDGNTAAVIESEAEPRFVGMLERAEVLHLAERMRLKK
ncbi:MAG: cation:proton antiporter [Planctomycetota bacterium]|nr:cation:proton antiporter [Planctomycetota bacterium]MDA1114361.1 cation:proton antiporter [Planctomycetota bacterium]